MKYLLVVLFCTLNFTSGFTQQLQVLKLSDSIPNVKEKGLAFISPKTDLEAYYFIAKIKITASDFNLILRKLQKTAIKLKANAFKYHEKKVIDTLTTVSITLYSVTPDLVEVNRKNLESNVIYFFGNDENSQKLKIDKQKIVLKPNEVYRFEIPKGKATKINKGGITGMTIYHNWQEYQPVIFYAFGKGNLTPSGNGYSTLGFSISTGSFVELRSDFAYLLLELKQK